MRRVACQLLVVGAALAGVTGLPAAVAAQGSTSVSLISVGVGGGHATIVSIPLRVTGYVAVRFHGDPASGCATSGLCGYNGTILWTPSRSGSLQIFQTRSHGRRRDDLSLQLDEPTGPSPTSGAFTSAEVQQTLTAPGAGDQECADVAAAGSQLELPQRQGRVRFRLAGATPSPFQTRCAGPLAADLASALAAPTESLRTVRRGEITIDLAGTRSFASHGFAGTVESTLTLRLGRPGRPQRLSTTTTTPGLAARDREVQVQFHAVLAGSVSAALGGDREPALCGPLGACGLHEALSIVPPAGGFTGQVEALGPAARPMRDFLAALGLSRSGNAHGIFVAGAAISSHGGALSAAAVQGSTSCHDSTGLGGGTVLLGSAHGRLSVVYEPGGLSGGALRTRCPGPSQPALAGLAVGSAPLGILSRRSASLSLDRGQSWFDDGYRGASTSHLTLTLRRDRIRTLLFRGPPGGI